MATAIAVIEDKNHLSTYTPAENLARQVLARMASMTAKLKDLEEDIRKLWQEFDNLKTGETILGCATKAEFCEKKLHRTPQAVRYMLNPELRVSKHCLPVENVKLTLQTPAPVATSDSNIEDAVFQMAQTDKHNQHSSASPARLASHHHMALLGAYYNTLRQAHVVSKPDGFRIVDSNNEIIPSEPSPLLEYAVRLACTLGGMDAKIDAMFPSKSQATEALTEWRNEVTFIVDGYTDQDLATAAMRCCGSDFTSLRDLQTHRQDVHKQAAVGGNFRKLVNERADPTAAAAPNETQTRETAQRLQDACTEIGMNVEISPARNIGKFNITYRNLSEAEIQQAIGDFKAAQLETVCS